MIAHSIKCNWIVILCTLRQIYHLEFYVLLNHNETSNHVEIGPPAANNDDFAALNELSSFKVHQNFKD